MHSANRVSPLEYTLPPIKNIQNLQNWKALKLLLQNCSYLQGVTISNHLNEQLCFGTSRSLICRLVASRKSLFWLLFSWWPPKVFYEYQNVHCSLEKSETLIWKGWRKGEIAGKSKLFQLLFPWQKEENVLSQGHLFACISDFSILNIIISLIKLLDN